VNRPGRIARRQQHVFYPASLFSFAPFRFFSINCYITISHPKPIENIHAVKIVASMSDSNILTSRDIHVLFLFKRLFQDNENMEPTHMATSDGIKITKNVTFTVITEFIRMQPASC